MATIDYSKFATVANQIITKFGTTGSLASKPVGTYTPGTSLAVVTPTLQTVKAVVFPYPAKLIDGTMIQVGDFQVFMSPDGVDPDPQPGDKLTYLSVAYTVIKVMTYNPAGTVCLYELQVRK